MKASSTTGVVPTPVVIVDALVPAPVVLVDDANKARRALLEKEIQGLRAKLNWTHLDEAARQRLLERMSQIQVELTA